VGGGVWEVVSCNDGNDIPNLSRNSNICDDEHMANIQDIQKKSGVQNCASVLGKPTISKEHPVYTFIEDATNILLQNGYGIVHGGYAGGAMSAASDMACQYIEAHHLSKELNIGVPQLQHDGLWDRVDGAVFTDPAEDIYARLKSISTCTIAVVCPLGGDGTELEETIIFHENVIREGLLVSAPDKAEPLIPLIFLQTHEGTNWRKILETKISLLDTSRKQLEEYSWLHVVESLSAFEELIMRLKN
jgi:predicted Rossmann-fold nucleotide-binding protein